MKISEIFNLQRTQWELDFVDIDPNFDTHLFIDPYFLSKRTDNWSINASRDLASFWQQLLRMLHENEIDQAKEIFTHLNEPNETCLGLSNGKPKGRGVGSSDAEKIFEALLETEAVRTGVVSDIEDCRIFIRDVDKDKNSDMTTNIIRGSLIQYTQAQCKTWGIPLQAGVPSGWVWNRADREWNSFHTEMLIVDGKKILLVPKAIVGYVQRFGAKQFHQHYVLNFLKSEHLKNPNSVLVRRTKRKDGTVKTSLSKKAIAESEAPLTKEFLGKFTQAHPEIFRAFKEETIKFISTITNEEITGQDASLIIDIMLERLRLIQPGSKSATQFHLTMVGIFEFLFYPNLISPQTEVKIHNGRKRIDITLDNAANTGFFLHLHQNYGIPSQFIMIECKNYSTDVANPELDQLAGRFSPNKGKVGIMSCRKIENMDLFIQRCKDTYTEDRGLILPITDLDIIQVLQAYKNGESRPEEKLLRDRYRQIAL